MKKVITLFAAMLLSLSLFSQEHLDFRGIPIDGHIDNFVAKMKTLGYVLDNKEDDAVIMKGKFTNRDADIFILCTPKTKTVYKVFIDFDKEASWSSLKSRYFDYKELYIKKYGATDNSYEFFSKPYYEGDGYELQALKLEKCTYATFFKTSKGIVAVELTKYECLRLVYEDKINIELRENERTASALNEI